MLLTPTRDTLTSERLLIDVRAPVEFARGKLPNAINLPLLNDDERARVGRCYKQHGQEAAIALGHDLVSGTVRDERVTAWRQVAEQAQAITCARGGLRSAIAQQWLAETGVTLPRIDGGFKAIRALCLQNLSGPRPGQPWWLVGGRTGSGKTLLIEACTAAIDLEAHANHRGSAFGGRPEGQPPPVTFEAALAVAFLRHDAAIVVLEDEGRIIGRLGLPEAWFAAMGTAPIAVVTSPLEERVLRIWEEYVAEPLAAGVPADALEQRYQRALGRIRKRLGGSAFQSISSALARAFSGEAHAASGPRSAAGHQGWIGELLTRYYDPMYDYQLGRKRSRVVFEGSRAEVLAYLNNVAEQAAAR